MDRNTILAIVLSVIVITVGMTLQSVFFVPNEVVTDQSVQVVEENNSQSISASSTAEKASLFSVSDTDIPSDEFKIQSKSLDITFDPKGGTISSIKLLEHEEDGEPVELLYKESNDLNAFMLYYGKDKTSPIDDIFRYRIEEKSVNSSSITQVTFSKDYEVAATGERFTIEKSFAIPTDNEYMIQLAVTIKSENGKSIPLNFNGEMYSLSVGPQIGPAFESLSRNYDYRRVIYKDADKGSRKNAKFKNGLFEYGKNDIDWIGLTGKYFAFLLIPETKGIISSISANELTQDSGIPQEDIIYLHRAYTNASSVTDVYSFYAGPQTAKTLGIYDKASDNIFGLSNHNLKKALEVSWLSWLETFLKWILEAFYFVVPNYGVAIILLTILVKICLIPISKKGLDSTAKMSALTPKMEEIKKKYADNPEEQNRAIAKLYQEEHINPMGSCIPMLIQFPIFIALYGLLNKNFELRGAMFIPGWIPDLSVPDTIATLPLSLPFLGPQIHLLPIIYTVSMIFSMKITQTTNTAQSQRSMILFMTYGMPIMFFFIMYNAPSGLLVYWTVTNVISIGQQVFTNHKKKGKYIEEIEAKDEAKKAKKKRNKR